MNTDTLEVPKKHRTRGLSKQNTAPEVILHNQANLPKVVGVKR